MARKKKQETKKLFAMEIAFPKKEKRVENRTAGYL